MKWASNPYDEQQGSANVPYERRQRFYEFKTEKPNEEFSTPNTANWPTWSKPDYVSWYVNNYQRPIAPKSMPRKAEPGSATGSQGTPIVEADFRGRMPNVGPAPFYYEREYDPWADPIDLTGNDGVEAAPAAAATGSSSTPKGELIKDVNRPLPPMAYDPNSESADEEEFRKDDDWVYPRIPDKLQYERYLKVGRTIADKIGTVKLMAQPAFALKPMTEEAIVPSKATISTFSSYLRKVTSYLASWTGCISMKILRSYRRKDDVEWLRLYNFCLVKTNLRQSHLYLGTRELAALCGLLAGDEEKIKSVIRPVIKKGFLSQIATSSATSVNVSGNIRQTNTGLFTDFDIEKKSNQRNITNIQGALSESFGWSNLHHDAVYGEFEAKGGTKYRCLEAIHRAQKFAKNLVGGGEEAQTGSSIHIWLSFHEFIRWNKDHVTATFQMEDSIQNEIVSMCTELVMASPVPVFVNLCNCSNFFGAPELGIEKILNRIAAIELAKVGVPTSANPLFWSECSNFIDGNLRTINPVSRDHPSKEGERWDYNAAFACVDKFLFREKMLYACISRRWHHQRIRRRPE